MSKIFNPGMTLTRAEFDLVQQYGVEILHERWPEKFDRDPAGPYFWYNPVRDARQA